MNKNLPTKRMGAYQRRWKFVIDGDSNTDPDRFEYNWWRMLSEKLESYPNVWVADNFAIAGSRWDDLIARQYRVQAVRDPRFRCALFLACGTNNINGDDETGTETLAWAQQYLDKARGWDAVVMIAIPPLSNATDNEYVDVYNAGIGALTGASFAVNRYGVWQLSNIRNRTYFVDNLHYSAAGCEVLSDLVKYQVGVKLLSQ